MTTRSSRRSSRRSFSGKVYRKLQLLREGYLLRELPDPERDRERYIVVEREANDLLPTIIRWWNAGGSLADLAEMADDEARNLYNEGRGLRAYIWDEAASIMRGRSSDLHYVEEALAYRNRPRLYGSLATGLVHGKRTFGTRNPWYGNLQEIVAGIHVNRWISHDGADRNVLYSLWRDGKELSPHDLKPAERQAIKDAGYAHIF